MPRLAFRNDRTRVWKKNGKPKRPALNYKPAAREGFYTTCTACHRIFSIDPDNWSFTYRHKTADNIPMLYCDNQPGEIGVWLEKGSYKITDINEIVNTPLTTIGNANA